MSKKADEYDRRAVIREVERIFNVKLSPVGRRRKFLQDQNGKHYLILVGIDSWHGIPKKLLTEARSSAQPTCFIVAQVRLVDIKIYIGQLDEEMYSRFASSCQKNQSLFLNFRDIGDSLLIKEFPDYSLCLLSTIPYTREHKDFDKKTDKLKKLLTGFSEDEIKEILIQSSHVG